MASGTSDLLGFFYGLLAAVQPARRAERARGRLSIIDRGYARSAAAGVGVGLERRDGGGSKAE
jgi:hypothetical protein